jgi:hypothetical protein
MATAIPIASNKAITIADQHSQSLRDFNRLCNIELNGYSDFNRFY